MFGFGFHSSSADQGRYHLEGPGQGTKYKCRSYWFGITVEKLFSVFSVVTVFFQVTERRGGGISGVQQRSLVILTLLQGPPHEETVEGHDVHVRCVFNRSLFWWLI